MEWSHAVSLTTDGAPTMSGRKAGVVTMFREKVLSARAQSDFWTFHCILHQEALCCKSLKTDNVMKVVIETVNSIQSRSLNHRQLDSHLNEKDHIYGLPYHTEVRWLSRGTVLRRFTRKNRKVYGSKEQTGVKISLQRIYAGPCIYGKCYRAP